MATHVALARVCASTCQNALGECCKWCIYTFVTFASLVSQQTNVLATFVSLANVTSTLLAKVYMSMGDKVCCFMQKKNIFYMLKSGLANTRPICQILLYTNTYFCHTCPTRLARATMFDILAKLNLRQTQPQHAKCRKCIPEYTGTHE
jgi:hypothetical protein